MTPPSLASATASSWWMSLATIFFKTFLRLLLIFPSTAAVAAKNTDEKKHKSTFTFNSFTPKSDWHLISPYHITPESNIKVRRMKELITDERSLWL